MGSGGNGISLFVIFKNVLIRIDHFQNTLLTEATTLSTSGNLLGTFSATMKCMNKAG